MKRMSSSLLIVGLLVLGYGITAQAAEPFEGTWKLNLAQSKYTGSRQAPKEQTEVHHYLGDTVDVNIKGVAADGSPIAIHFTHMNKGEGPMKLVEGSLPPGVTIMVKVSADAYTMDLTTTRENKVVGTVHSFVTKDGKSLRSTSKGTDAQGKPYASNYVFDKQ